MPKLRFRQVHLDFHTSPVIEGIGAAFDRQAWQDTLRKARVNSITCFALCHHGWSYNETKLGVMHPHLRFDLLKAQFEACKAIDVNVPIYLTAGVNNRVAEEHPEWREIGPDGAYQGWTRSPLDAGFKKLCFNTPYLDYLCGLIRETAEQFPDCDGIFLDIIAQGPCCCPWCLRGMAEAGLDARDAEARLAWSRRVLLRYYEETTRAARATRDDMPVFHNSGHITKGDTGILKFFSHLELESLPTGGWGYDHFPMSAKYAINLKLDFLGMTGKFHDTWGDFGGYKHPNALRYECAAMQAFGSKCSVGDQLHPGGGLDASTYAIIGAAYREVEACEPWCDDVRSVADLAVLAVESAGRPGTAAREHAADVGAGRLLLEGHFLFDVIDADMAFDKYRTLILPDEIDVHPAMKARLDAFLATGGKLILSGNSGYNENGEPLFDIGALAEGLSPMQPDFVVPSPDIAPDFVTSPFVMPMPSRRLRVTDGQSLGDVVDPYFNRRYDHFCSHQYAPPRPVPSGYASAVRKGNILTFAHPVFSIYRGSGAVTVKAYVLNTLRQFLGEDCSLSANLPSTARVSVMEQPARNRRVVHLLQATTLLRGGLLRMSTEGYVRESQPVEVIEDLLPLHAVQVRVRAGGPVSGVTLEPQGQALAFLQDGDWVSFTVESFTCHQMVVLQR